MPSFSPSAKLLMMLRGVLSSWEAFAEEVLLDLLHLILLLHIGKELDVLLLELLQRLIEIPRHEQHAVGQFPSHLSDGRGNRQ